ncbi:hypothetical protein TWF730_010663 [Orbilia blumenaviensis]|uniref:Uncharacterized protein n=1 Tax=Orbilia blumenaviensis TaxID=1796055 RepID=A0AAV9USQ2_9PEZI
MCSMSKERKMKTLTIFLLVLRLTSAAPTPVDVNAPTVANVDGSSVGGLDLEGHCCFDAERVMEKACDIPLCLRNFFSSKEGRPVAEALLAASDASPGVSVLDLLPPQPKESMQTTGTKTGRKARRGATDINPAGSRGEVFGDGADNSDLVQCTAQVIETGNFGSDTPLCQQLLLDHLAPAAGFAHKEATARGALALGSQDHAADVYRGKVARSLAELSGN